MQEPKYIFELAGDTKEATQLYVKYKIDYYKLHVAERVTTFATFAIGGILLLTLLGMFLLFTSLAAAMYLGEVLSNNNLGYFIVGIFYLVALKAKVLIVYWNV
jgi:hypothetical protein